MRKVLRSVESVRTELKSLNQCECVAFKQLVAFAKVRKVLNGAKYGT